jgi:hypothetical protein
MSRNGVVYYCCTYYKAVRGDSGGHALPIFAVVTHFVVEMAMFVTDPTECVTYDGVDMRVDR